MKEHGFLFKGSMVLAIRDKYKTNTRRPVTFDNSITAPHVMRKNWGEMRFNEAWLDEKGPSPAGNPGPYWHVPFRDIVVRVYPRVQPGDQIWVREHWGYLGSLCSIKGRKQDCSKSAFYHADNTRASIPFKDFKTMMDAPPHQNYKLLKNWDEMDEYDKEFHKDNWLKDWWKRVKSIPSIQMPRWASRIDLDVLTVRSQRIQDISAEDVLTEGIDMREVHSMRTERALIYAFHALWDTINAERGYGWDTNPPVWVYEFKQIKGK